MREEIQLQKILRLYQCLYSTLCSKLQKKSNDNYLHTIYNEKQYVGPPRRARGQDREK